MENKKIIDDRYIIDHRIGSGGEGVAYLVKDKNKDNELKLVAKVLEFEGNEDEEEYEEDDENEKRINNAIDIFNRISHINPPYPYIIRCIFQKKGKITKNGKLIKNRNYFIFEYAQKGDLWKLIKLTEGFGERCSKILFKKILLGVQKLHELGIYHLDLKIDNIVLDENNNPKICDFGLATIQQGILDYSVGTKEYKPPQMYEDNIQFTGERADIFSLGCVLFALVAKGPWFEKAEKNDSLYKYIYNNQSETYFEKLSITIPEVKNFSEDFKNLYTKMIAYNEEERPGINEILADVWFNEINNLTDEQKDNEVRTKVEEKENKIKTILDGILIY